MAPRSAPPARAPLAPLAPLAPFAPFTAIAAGITAAVLTACGGGSGTGTASPTAPPPPSTAADATAGVTISPAAGPTAGPVVPPLPGGGERAFVANATGLVEVSTAGGSQIVAPLASWCNVDARANVVWFATRDDLHVFDLVDRRVRMVVHGSYANDLEPIIDWGSEQLGGESKVLFDVGAALRLGRSNPELEVVMGCEGDRAPFCFGDDDETPTDSVTRLQRQASALRISDPAYLTQLARRGAHASLWPPPPVPPTPPKRKPVTDRKECTELVSCGTLIAIPASPLWLVVTANSRADYYHETRELWDPATGEYIRRDGDRLERFKAPRNESGRSTDYRGLRVSPAGVLSYDGAVFDGAKVYYAPPGPADSADSDGITCGWASGGWRIAGPSDG